MATGELEKITVNMAPVDLGQIDLLVREGFYQNRTDFIRTALSQPSPTKHVLRRAPKPSRRRRDVSRPPGTTPGATAGLSASPTTAPGGRFVERSYTDPRGP